MKTNFVRAALACAVLALSATAAIAEPGKPIEGTDVGLDHKPDPPGGRVANGVTDNEGNVRFGKLAPGEYVLVIDGPTLVRAMDRLALPVPAKHDSGPSVGLSVGGLFGGGGSHHSDHQGAGPTQGSHGGTHSGGGIGLGVALGDVNGDGTPDSVVRPGDQIDRIAFTLVVTASPGGSVTASLSGSASSRAPDARGSTFSSETPYCRQTAGQGMHIGFTVPEGAPANVEMSIFDRWGNL